MSRRRSSPAQTATYGDATMATREQAFPTRFLKAADLGGKPAVVTIKEAAQEKLKNGNGEEETKTVLYFQKGKKALVLNLTNWTKIADVTGEDDSDNWPGHRIEVFPTTTEMKGKEVDCIRVRKPGQGELPIKKKTAPPPMPEPKPPLADELDDEIPW
jgi:hypothetical protein